MLSEFGLVREEWIWARFKYVFCGSVREMLKDCVIVWFVLRHSNRRCKGTLQLTSVSLPLASVSLPLAIHLRCLFRGILNWTHCGRTSAKTSDLRFVFRLPLFSFYFISHYGVMGSRHLSSYFPSYDFHFIYLFHCPIVVYISTLSDRKVPILFFLDFLSGKSLSV